MARDANKHYVYDRLRRPSTDPNTIVDRVRDCD